jgi:hypothetical protein
MVFFLSHSEIIRDGDLKWAMVAPPQLINNQLTIHRYILNNME